MTSDSAVITLEAVSKRYGSRTVVDDLSFTVEPGKVTGFPGPNGTGKPVTGLGHSLWLGTDGGRRRDRVSALRAR